MKIMPHIYIRQIHKTNMLVRPSDLHLTFFLSAAYLFEISAGNFIGGECSEMNMKDLKLYSRTDLIQKNAGKNIFTLTSDLHTFME